MEKVDFKDKELFIGLDVHKKSWSVSIFSSESHFKTFSQPSSPKALKTYLDRHFPNASIKCAYEASKFGFWIQRELSSYGYECLVVNPADIPSTHKENVEKTDPVDSRKIGRALRAGQLKGIYIPKIETEGLRQLFRYRKKLWADLVNLTGSAPKTASKTEWALQVFHFRLNLITHNGHMPLSNGSGRLNCPVYPPEQPWTYSWNNTTCSKPICLKPGLLCVKH